MDSCKIWTYEIHHFFFLFLKNDLYILKTHEPRHLFSENIYSHYNLAFLFFSRKNYLKSNLLNLSFCKRKSIMFTTAMGASKMRQILQYTHTPDNNLKFRFILISFNRNFLCNRR